MSETVLNNFTLADYSLDIENLPQLEIDEEPEQSDVFEEDDE